MAVVIEIERLVDVGMTTASVTLVAAEATVVIAIQVVVETIAVIVIQIAAEATVVIATLADVVTTTVMTTAIVTQVVAGTTAAIGDEPPRRVAPVGSVAKRSYGSCSQRSSKNAIALRRPSRLLAQTVAAVAAAVVVVAIAVVVAVTVTAAVTTIVVAAAVVIVTVTAPATRVSQADQASPVYHAVEPARPKNHEPAQRHVKSQARLPLGPHHSAPRRWLSSSARNCDWRSERSESGSCAWTT